MVTDSVLQLNAPYPIFTRKIRCISLLIKFIDHSLLKQFWNDFATPQYWVDWLLFSRVFCKLLQHCDRWVKIENIFTVTVIVILHEFFQILEMQMFRNSIQRRETQITYIK